MSMVSIFMRENPIIFPDPHEYRQDRWLKGNLKERLNKYLLPFSKGTREDVEVVRDLFNPSVRLDLKGVRVLVK